MPQRKDNDLVLGDDFVAPTGLRRRVDRAPCKARLVFAARFLAHRKIVTFNLIALNVLVVGILYLNSSLDNLAMQRANSLKGQTALIADVVEARLPVGVPVSLATGDGMDVEARWISSIFRPARNCSCSTGPACWPGARPATVSGDAVEDRPAPR